MSTIKKRQHYVWRHYLRSWADKESIWTYFKQFNKVEKTGLMGIAQEKYFYKLIDLDKDEEKFLKKYLDHTCHPSVKGLCLDFLRAFTSHTKLKKHLEETNTTEANSDFLKAEIRKLEINLMEDVHGKFESNGAEFIAARSIDDLKSLRTGDKFYDSMIFLCVQYFRTNSMKQSVKSSFQGEGKFEEMAGKFWNIVSFSMALNVARSISLDPKTSFTIYESVGDQKFLTSDQPVFNLKNEALDNEGNVKELEFYYPLSPTHALLIHFQESETKYYQEKLTDERVTFLNNKVIQNSHFFVFGNEEQQMRSLIE